MSITHHSSVVLDLRPNANGIDGRPGVGVHRLRFSINYRTVAWPNKIFIARNFRADVSVVTQSLQNETFLGRAWPENAWTVSTSPHAYDGSILFILEVTPEQLALLESARAGGSFRFEILVQCEVDDRSGIVHGSYERVQFTINASAWIDILRQLGTDRVILLEVEIPDTNIPELQSAVALVRRARREIDAGNYDGAVRECRMAIESTRKALGLTGAIDAAVRLFCEGKKKSMTKIQRGHLVCEAALHYTHLAHHVDDEGARHEFGRRDAAFMLALASAVVANLAIKSS